MTINKVGGVFDKSLVVRSFKYRTTVNIWILVMSTFKKEKAPLKPTRKARNELTEEQKQ